LLSQRSVRSKYLNNMLKNLVIWLVIGLVLMTVFNQFNTRQVAQAPMEYSQFLEEVKAGRIAKVTIEGRQLKAQTTEGKRVTSYSPGDIRLVSDLLKYGVKIEAKEEVAELVDFLRDPSKFQRLGGRIPRGVLMVGAPGTGKTLLARAIAGEAKVPFFSISGSDFVEMFVGVGAARVRDMFEQAKKHAPCIVFIDEIDAVGRQRGAGLGGGNDEREQTLNQLLVDMDDFERAKDKIIMGAERRSMVMPEERRRNTAYHESGHAIVARLLPKTDPVHKVTIIPRGRALGVTMQLPETDRYSQDRDRLLNMIAVLFGGRIAEELFMKQMTTGAANDFERATEIARRMVTQ